MNKNLIIAILIFIITVGVLSRTGCNPKIVNTNDHTLDSLQNIIDQKDIREMELVDKSDSIQFLKDSISKVKSKIVVKYIEKKEVIQALPLNEGMIFLSKYVSFDKTFPHKLIVNSDTTVLINKEQLKDVNTIIVEKQGCLEILEETNKEVNLLESKDSINILLIKTLNEEDVLKGEQIEDLKSNLILERHNVKKLNKNLKLRKFFSTIKESVMVSAIVYLVIK